MQAAATQRAQLSGQQVGAYSGAQPVSTNQPASNIDLDSKKLTDIVDALTFIGNIRENINIILDNVGKANTSNNYAAILSVKNSLKQQNDSNSQDQSKNLASQNNQDKNEQDIIMNSDQCEKFLGMDSQQQNFFEKTDTKYLQDRIVDLNKNLT
jgi:hypothetical protein